MRLIMQVKLTKSLKWSSSFLFLTLQNKKENAMREVYHTGHQLDVDLIIGILDENGIQADVRYCGAGDYMKILGAVYNADCQIYVPDSDYNRARQLIKSVFDNQQTRNKTGSYKGQRIFAWIMIIFWMLVFIGIFVFEIM